MAVGLAQIARMIKTARGEDWLTTLVSSPTLVPIRGMQDPLEILSLKNKGQRSNIAAMNSDPSIVHRMCNISVETISFQGSSLCV